MPPQTSSTADFHSTVVSIAVDAGTCAGPVATAMATTQIRHIQQAFIDYHDDIYEQHSNNNHHCLRDNAEETVVSTSADASHDVDTLHHRYVYAYNNRLDFNFNNSSNTKVVSSNQQHQQQKLQIQEEQPPQWHNHEQQHFDEQRQHEPYSHHHGPQYEASSVVVLPTMVVTSSSRRRRSSKVVKFSRHHDNIKEIPNILSYTKAEIESMWYTDEEVDNIREHRAQTIDKMRWGYEIPKDDVDDTDVGLYTYIEQARKESYVQYAVQAVLDEQEYQCEIGAIGTYAAEYAIANAYFECTCEMQWEALERGLWLRDDMDSILDDDDDDDGNNQKKNHHLLSPLAKLISSIANIFSTTTNTPSVVGGGGGLGANKNDFILRGSTRSCTNRSHCSNSIRRHHHATSAQQHLHVTRALSFRAASSMVDEMLSILGCV